MNSSENMMNMKWPEIQEAVDRKSIVLMPLGVVEEHGPHLCLGTDIYTAETVCSSVQNELSSRAVPSIIAPPFYWGICQSTRGFIGSFSIRMETAVNLVLDILSSLQGFGFTEAYGINAHGDIEQNILFMSAFKEAVDRFGIKARYCFRSEVLHHYGLTGDEEHICPISPQSITVSESKAKDIHAGDIETAIISRYYPSRADTETAKRLPGVSIEPEREMEWLSGGKTKELSGMGYMGDPANYDSVRIKEHIADITDRYVRAILKKRGSQGKAHEY